MDKREFLIGILSMMNENENMTDAERLVLQVQKNNLILELSQLIAKEREELDKRKVKSPFE